MLGLFVCIAVHNLYNALI